MSDNKKYYYLKLKENFFESEDMILLESMENGLLYSNILLKLYLKSLKNEGKLMFKDRIPYNPSMLAKITRHNVDVVEKALKIFEELGIIEVLDNGIIYMMDIQEFIGQGSSEAERKQRYREKINKEKQLKMGHCPTNVPQLSENVPKTSGQRPPELEIEIELEKELELDVEIEKKAKSPTADIPNELKNLPCERDLPPLENNTPKAFEFYEENFVKPNGKVQAPQAIANDLIQQIQMMGDDLVLLALQKTLEKDATWRYTKTILDNWKKTGIKTLEQALNEKKPTNKNKNPKNMTMKETIQNINWDELEG